MLLDWCPPCLEVVQAESGLCPSCSTPTVLAFLDRKDRKPRPPRRGWSSYYVPEPFRRPGGNALVFTRTAMGRTITKPCRKCGLDKPHRKRADSDNARSTCIDCTAEYLRDWRRENWQRRKIRDTWKGMINRCHNPKAMRRWAWASGVPDVRSYADAGITVCARWRDPATGLENFLADMGMPPTPEHTLDRLRTRKNYSPGNCRWATPDQQARNRANVHIVEAPDPTTGQVKRMNLSEWAKVSGIARTTISNRIGRGWDPVRAVAEVPGFVEGVPF